MWFFFFFRFYILFITMNCICPFRLWLVAPGSRLRWKKRREESLRLQTTTVGSISRGRLTCWITSMQSRMRSPTGWISSNGSWMVRGAEGTSVTHLIVFLFLTFPFCLLSSVLESWMDYTGELEPPEPLSRLPQLKHRMKRLLTQLGKVHQISLYSSTWGRQRTTAALVPTQCSVQVKLAGPRL